MNRLTDYRSAPPEQVTIEGETYTLNANFRNALLTLAALTDKNLFDWEKADIILGNMYDEPPQNTQEAINAAVSYLMLNRDEIEDKPPAIDFEQDSQLIYDAFLSMGVNLDTTDLSWWTFLSYLRELPKDCFLCRVVFLRSLIDSGKIRNKEHRVEREEIKRIGEDVVYLEHMRNFNSWRD